MSVRATATYCLHHEAGSEESIEVELSTDATYSPDIASDLTRRVKATLAETIADTWPSPAPTP